MKFWLCFAALSCFCSLAEVKTLPPIKLPAVIDLGEKSKREPNLFKKAQDGTQLRSIYQPVNTNDYQAQMMIQDQDWNETLKNINDDIDKIKNALRTKEGQKNAKYYNTTIAKLILYRGIANLHLKNYGLAMVDMRYVINQDKSYLTYKPVLYMFHELNLDQIMNAVWKFMYKLDEHFCNISNDRNICYRGIAPCYKTSWYENSCGYNIKYATPPYNDTKFIDITNLISYYYLNTVCVSCIFIDSPKVTMLAAAPVCEVYSTNVKTGYLSQLDRLRKITSSSTQEVEDYLCRGFTNIMLMEENTSVPNATYIANAKTDLKTAISKNSALPEAEKIKEVADNLVTAIFGKYNQIITKGMDAEQKALIQSAMTQPNLTNLKDRLTEQYSNINVIAETGIDHSVAGNQTSNTAIDVTGELGTVNTIGYTQNPAANVTNINNIMNDKTTDETAKKQQLLKTTRATAAQAVQTEKNLDTLLQMINELQSTGVF